MGEIINLFSITPSLIKLVMAPDVIRTYDLAGCCLIHDIAYKKQTGTRKEADLDFKWCLNRVANPCIAYIYYYGVRAFGWVSWLLAKSRA